jgi:hypothetical protein
MLTPTRTAKKKSCFWRAPCRSTSATSSVKPLRTGLPVGLPFLLSMHSKNGCSPITTAWGFQDFRHPRSLCGHEVQPSAARAIFFRGVREPRIAGEFRAISRWRLGPPLITRHGISAPPTVARYLERRMPAPPRTGRRPSPPTVPERPRRLPAKSLVPTCPPSPPRFGPRRSVVPGCRSTVHEISMGSDLDAI